VWVCVCVGFVMCGCVYVWVCVGVGFVICGCFGKMYTVTLRLPWPRFFRAFSSVVRQMPG